MQATRTIHRFVIAALCALHCACGDGSDVPASAGLPAVDPEPTATIEPPPPQPTAAQDLPPPQPTATETPPATSIVAPGCEGVIQESLYCLTMTEGALAMIGLESGDLCHVTNTDAPLSVSLLPIGLAWVGEYVYACNEIGLVRIALDDGTWEAAGSPCDSVAAQDGGLLVYRGWSTLLSTHECTTEMPGLAWYADFDAVASESPQRVYSDGLWSTMTAQGERLFTAWHSTDTIDVHDLASDMPAGALTLEDHDDWIQSLSATADDHLVLIGGIFSDRLVVFDVHNGRQVRNLELEPAISGLACVANGPPRDTPTATPTPTPQTNATAEPTATPCAPFDCPELCGRPQAPPLALHELPASIANASCARGDRSSNYVTPDELLVSGSAEELHVISAYRGAGDPGFRAQPQGAIDVVVQPRTKPVALALAAYEQTRWRITLQPGAILSRVIVQGYEPQIVDGVPPDVPIIQRDPLQSCGAASRWETDGDGAFSPMIANLRDFTGLIESSFQGCYTGDRFEVPHWSGDPPPPPAPLTGDETIANRELQFSGCEDIHAESGRCLTTTSAGIGLLGLDSGTICPVVASTAPALGEALASIAWRGEFVYVCSYGEGLIRVSLRNGDWRPTQRSCRAVTACGDDLLLLDGFPGDLHRYGPTEDLLAHRPSSVYQFDAWFLHIACDGDQFYGTTSTADPLFAADLATGQPLPPVPLSEIPTFLDVLAVTGAGEIATTELEASYGPRSLSIFDADGGGLVRTLPVAQSFAGLSCISQ